MKLTFASLPEVAKCRIKKFMVKILYPMQIVCTAYRVILRKHTFQRLGLKFGAGCEAICLYSFILRISPTDVYCKCSLYVHECSLRLLICIRPSLSLSATNF